MRFWKTKLCAILFVTCLCFTFFATPTHAASLRPDCGVGDGGTQVMHSGFTWKPGASLWDWTCSGTSIELIFQSDNNFVLYIGGHAKWSTGTYFYGSDIKPDYVQFQSDGNLVLYSYVKYGNYYYVQPQWASGTAGKGATNLNLQADGNLVIYRGNTALWASNTCCYH